MAKIEKKPLDVFEDYARSLVSMFTGLEVEEFDSGGGKVQRPDFKLSDNGQLVGYLEVSSDVNREELEFYAALHKLRGNDGTQELSVAGDGLVRDWIVYVDPGARAKDLLARVPTLLTEWEAARGGDWLPDVDSAIGLCDGSDGPPLELLVNLRDIHVSSLMSLPVKTGGDSGRFILQQQSLDTSRADPVAEAQKVLNQPDNLRKYEYSSLPSEMFVWLSGTEGSFGLASKGHHPYELRPLAPLRLPRNVQRVWLAAMPAYNVHWAETLWTFTAMDGWAKLIPRS